MLFRWCGGWGADGCVLLDIKAVVQSLVMEDAGHLWYFLRLGREATAGLSCRGSFDPVHIGCAVGSLVGLKRSLNSSIGIGSFRERRGFLLRRKW